MKKLAFLLEIEGSEKVVSNFSKVKLELSAINKELNAVQKDIENFNKASEEEKRIFEAQGKSIEALNNSYKTLTAKKAELTAESNRLSTQLRQQAKDFDRIKQEVPDDSLIGLRRRYEQLRQEIDKLGKEARSLPQNLAKIKEAENVKQQIDDITASVRDFRSNVGNYKEGFASILDIIKGAATGGNSSAISGIINPLSGLIGGGGGIGQVISQLTKATDVLGPYGKAAGVAIGATTALVTHIANVTVEYTKLNNAVANLTGLTGANLQNATVGVKTISEVFNKDFNEVLIAANSLTKEVTGDFNKSIELIKIGFLSGADASDEFLQSLREYSTQIGAAGASGEQFIEILTRAQQEGIYSDKGIDLVKEFGLRIREQTTTTTTALEQAFGKAFTKDLFDGINEGSVTTVDALVKVSDALKTNQLTAKQTQQLLADVFGGPGEDAGLRFIKILSEVDGDLSDILDTTDAYTKKQLELFDATRDLNSEQEILASQFAGTGFSMDTLITKSKALGTSLLNDILLNGRAIFDTFKNGKIGEGLLAIINPALAPTLLSDERAKILAEDAEALRQIRDGEKKLADDRRKNALQGKLSIEELRQEQALLKKELDASRVSGEDLTDKMQQYTTVTNQITAATKLLNGNLDRTKANFKELTALGSIESLQKKVSDLQSQIDKSTPNKAKALIDDLNNAELDLSKAKAELDEFKKSLYDSIDISSLPLDAQVERLNELVELRKATDISIAKDSIDNQQQLQDVLQKIELKSSIEQLENKKRLYKETSQEYEKLILEIKDKNRSIETIDIRIKLSEAQETINEVATLNERILREAFDNESELQDRLNLLKLNKETAYLNKRLEIEKLDANQRYALENELDQKLREALKQRALVATNYTAKINEINNAENLDIVKLIPEFDPADLETTLQALRDFEDNKKVIQIEAQIQRFDIQKELLIKQGEDINDIERQIAEKKLELDQAKNEKIIEEHKKRIEIQKQLDQSQLDAAASLIEGVGNILSEGFDDNIDSAEKAQKAFIKLMLDTVEKVILAQIAASTAQSLAQPDSVATFGVTGLARATILTALIKAAFSVAKSAIGKFEYGDIISARQLKSGGVFTGKRHSQGGSKFFYIDPVTGQPIAAEAEVDEVIINRPASLKWPGLLSAINEDTGGKKFSADSGRWKLLLDKLQGKYEKGSILGSSSVNTYAPPASLLNSNIMVSAMINRQDILEMARIIADEQVSILIPKILEIPGAIQNGLDRSNRMSERIKNAQQDAQI